MNDPGGDCTEAAVEGLAVPGLQRLDAWLRSEIDQARTSGAVVSIVRNQRPVYFEPLGFRDRRQALAMRHDSIFRIASMTKPLVSVAALMLMEEGSLTLADPLEGHVPEFKDMQVGNERTDPSGVPRLSLEGARRPITIQDLLRHTSGLTTSLFAGSMIRQMYRDVSIRDDQQTNAELASKLAGLPLMYQPGTTFEYSMSTDVLGRVIEVIAGVDLNRFIVDRIARPLGMEDTAFVLDERQLDRLAVPQAEPAAASVLAPYSLARPPRWFSGGSGAFSTAGDFTRFCRMLQNGGTLDGLRILSRKSVELMCEPHLPCSFAVAPSTEDLGITAPLAQYGQSYGLGVGVRVHPGLSPVPGSVGDFFWGGALGTYFWVDPRERLIAILMMQEPDARRRAHYRSVFRNLVYQALRD